MKKVLKATALIASFAAFGLIAGCGDDNPSTPTGKIVKGAVGGETVVFGQFTTKSGTRVFQRYTTGAGATKKVVSATTNADGTFTFPITGKAYQTSGTGTYTDVNGKLVKAPVLSARATDRNANVLTSLLTINPAIESKIQALIGTSVKIDDDLSGTVTVAKKAAAQLNEALGAVLLGGTTPASATVAATSAITATEQAQLLAKVASTIASTPIASFANYTGTTRAANVVTSVVITPAVTAYVAANPTSTVATNQAAITTAASTVASSIKTNTTIPSKTGSTGGTSSGTGSNQ